MRVAFIPDETHLLEMLFADCTNNAAIAITQLRQSGTQTA